MSNAEGVRGPAKFRKALSTAEMRHQIQRLNRINADLAEWKTIRKIYRDLFPEVQLVIGTTKSSEQFFRARVNPPAKPQAVTELMAPPAEYVTGYQRCNPPGSPIFYCSTRRIIALEECRVREGDLVYLAQWIGLDRLPITKFLDTTATDFFEKLSEAESILYAHLDTIFTRRVHHTFSNDYKFSSAVTDQVTTNFPDQFGKVAADGRIGLSYPSIFDMEQSLNYAFPPAWASERMQLLHVMELRIDEIGEGGTKVTMTDTANKFADGQIQWSGNMLNIPRLRETSSSVLLRCDGDTWNIATVEHDYHLDCSPQEYIHRLLVESPEAER